VRGRHEYFLRLVRVWISKLGSEASCWDGRVLERIFSSEIGISIGSEVDAFSYPSCHLLGPGLVDKRGVEI